MLKTFFNFINRSKNEKWLTLLLILIAVGLTILPIPFYGIPSGTDLLQHLQFASTYHDSILTGDFFPGWSTPDNQGLGSVGIRFYPPFAYYLLALTQMLFNDWFTSYWVNTFIWMLVGCLGVFWWSKTYLSPFESAITAALYALAPYHLFQIYQASLFAEFAAAGVLPFCFLAVNRLVVRGKPLDFLLLILSLSILILTHIPTTIFGVLTLFIFTILLCKRKELFSVILKFSIALLLSSMATAFYWIKIITEIDWVKHSSDKYFSKLYSYQIYLFPMSYSFGKFVPHFDLPNLLLILILLPLLYLWWNRRKTGEFQSEVKIWQALLGSGLFCAFMLSALSKPVWDAFPILQKIQFPWRWQSAASLIGVLACVTGLTKIFRLYPGVKRPLGYVLILLFTSIIIFDLTQSVLTSAPLTQEAFAREFSELKAQKGCECWQPVWAKDSAFDQKEKVLTTGREIIIEGWENESRIIKILKGTQQNIHIANFYYPHWKAKVNGVEVEISKGDDGTILVPISETESVVELNFVEPLSNKVFLMVSALTWLTLLGFVLLNLRKKYLFQPTQNQS
jgi:hypothetical protein